MLHILFWILAEEMAIFQQPSHLRTQKWCRWVQMYRITQVNVKFVEIFFPLKSNIFISICLDKRNATSHNNEMVWNKLQRKMPKLTHDSLVKHKQCEIFYTYFFMHKYLSLVISLAGWTALRSCECILTTLFFPQSISERCWV